MHFVLKSKSSLRDAILVGPIAALLTLAALFVGLAAFCTSRARAQTIGFTANAFTGDADSGISASNTYTIKANIIGGNVTINGVTFIGSGSDTFGTGWSLTGTGQTFGGGGIHEFGGTAVSGLFDGFRYDGNPGVMTLSGLTVGQAYTTTFYNQAWEFPGTRLGNVTAGTDSISYNQDMAPGSLLSYTFVASATTQAINFTPTAGGTFHFYGFSNQDQLSNTLTLASGGTLTLNESSTTTNPISLSGAGTHTIAVSTGNTPTLSGVISGSGDLTKQDAGTLTLSGANTYAGVTTLAGGVLNVATFSDYGVAGGLGNRAVGGDGSQNVGILFQGGTLQYTGSTAQSTNRAIRISTVGGGATIDASGSNPAATLSFTATSSPDFFENGGNRTLTLTGSNTGANTFAMAIAEAGGTTTVVKNGVGTWVLSGANTYGGVTYVNAGMLVVANSSALGQSGWSGANMTWVYDGATLALQGGVSIADHMHVFGAGVGGLGAIRSLSGNNELPMTQGNSGSGPGFSIDSNTTVGVDAGSLTLTGFYETGGSFVLTKVGAGTLVFSQYNTHTGGTTVNGGTLQINNATALNSGALTLAAGTQFTLNTSGTTANAIYLSGAGPHTIAVSTGNTFTLSGVISGIGGLTKQDAGTLTLSNANTYTGATIVNAATMELTNTTNGAVGTLAVGSSITVNSGGTLLGSGFNALGHSSDHAGDLLTINKGGTLLVGAGTVLSMPYELNVVGGTIASVDGGFPGLGTIYYASTSGTFTSAIDGTAATISTQNFNLVGAQFNVVQGGGAVDLNVTGNLIGGPLTKNGNGTMVLSGANTYTGGTTVSGGTLQIGGAGSLGSGNHAGAISIDTGANLKYSSSAPQTFSGVISGAGSLTKDTSSRTLNLSGGNTYSGGTNITNGNIMTDASNAIGSGAVTVASDANWILSANGQTHTIAGLSGAGNVTRLNQTSLGAATGADGASQISTAKNYLQLLDFGNAAGATVNGVAFQNVSSNSGPNWNLTGATAQFFADAGSGYAQLMSDFLYNGTPGVLTFSNLTVGKTYQAMLYTQVGVWGNRPQDGTFTNGANTQALSFDPVNVGYVAYSFTATDPTATISMAPQLPNSTFHWFGASLEDQGTQTGAASTITVGDANNYTFSGVLSGNLSLIKQGTGVQTLSGANTYTGTTTISGGTLQIAGSGSLGNGNYAGNIVNTASLAVATSADQTLSGVISGTNGTLTKSGAGTLTLSAANTYTGATAINGGTLKLAGRSLVTPSAVIAESAYTPDDRAAVHTIDGTGMTPGSPVTVAGYNGATTTSASGNSPGGTMWLSNGNTPSWITFDLGSTQTINGFHLWNYNEAAFNLFSRGVNSASLYTQNSLTGDTNLGTLIQNMTFTQATGLTIDTGADYTFSSQVTARYIEIFANTHFANGTFPGDNYIGLSEIRFQQIINNLLPTATALTIGSGATLDLNSASQTVGSLADGTGGGSITNTGATASTLTLNPASGSTSFSGVIGGGSGAISLVKSGAGTQILTGANTYTGATLISGGTLMLGNGGTTGSLSSSSNITNNGTLNFNRSNAIVQGTDFGSIITPSSGKLVQSGAGMTKLTAANDFSGNTEVTFGILELGAADALKSTANVNVTGGTLLLSGSGNRINDSAGIKVSTNSITVPAMTFSGNVTESMGALTLNGAGTSVIDLGAGTSSITFADTGTWTGVLAVWNYTGGIWDAASGDKLFFTANSGLVAPLTQVHFYSNNGVTEIGTGGGFFSGSTGQLVPVPESSALGACGALLGFLGFRHRRSAVQQRKLAEASAVAAPQRN